MIFTHDTESVNVRLVRVPFEGHVRIFAEIVKDISEHDYIVCNVQDKYRFFAVGM